MHSNARAFRFRIAEAGDAAAVVAFVNAAYHGPEAARGWTPETHLHAGPRTDIATVEKHIANADARIIICDDEQGLLGSAVIERNCEDCLFGTFAVRTAGQNSGAGKALIAEAERQAKALWRCRTMTLGVINLQTKLIAYYERRGFVQTGAREPFPFDDAPGAIRTDYDIIIMRKLLD